MLSSLSHVGKRPLFTSITCFYLWQQSLKKFKDKQAHLQDTTEQNKTEKVIKIKIGILHSLDTYYTLLIRKLQKLNNNL